MNAISCHWVWLRMPFLPHFSSLLRYLLLDSTSEKKKKMSGFSKGLPFEEMAVLLYRNDLSISFCFLCFVLFVCLQHPFMQILHFPEVHGFLALRNMYLSHQLLKVLEWRERHKCLKAEMCEHARQRFHVKPLVPQQMFVQPRLSSKAREHLLWVLIIQ